MSRTLWRLVSVVTLSLGMTGLAGCATRSGYTADGLPPPRPNFVVPAIEIVAFEAALNLNGRRMFNDGTFEVTPGSIRRNLRGPWVVDSDSYAINQIGHPYQGATYHTISRSTGLSYWQAAGYTFAGSVLWELAGETTPPSFNDQIASGIAGTFLGEGMFRAANLLIDKAGGRPGPGRLMVAGLLSPATAFNRVLFGGRFDGVMPTFEPMYDARMQVGASTAWLRSPGSLSEIRRDGIMLDMSLEYGLPGKPGYVYSRPFDHFTVQATASSARGLESVMSTGLIAGRGYDAGANGRGVWGLYGVYDYLSPELFRISTTAFAVGTSTQWWTGGSFGVQTTALAGMGYSAAQTLANRDDYRYGLTPQASAALRLTAGNRVSFDVAGRGYLVSDIGGYETPTDDLILRGEAGLGVRLFWRHAVSLRYQLHRRDTSLLNDGVKARQQRQTVGLFYTLLGPQGFGATRWNR